jgi:hypothetical protein
VPPHVFQRASSFEFQCVRTSLQSVPRNRHHPSALRQKYWRPVIPEPIPGLENPAINPDGVKVTDPWNVHIVGATGNGREGAGSRVV